MSTETEAAATSLVLRILVALTCAAFILVVNVADVENVLAAVKVFAVAKPAASNPYTVTLLQNTKKFEKT